MTSRLEDLSIDPEVKVRDSLGESWFFCWSGIALSGGAFGLTIGLFIALGEAAPSAVFIGFVAGTFLAGVWAIPIVTIVGTLAWVMGLSRFRRTPPSLAGACTGLISTGVSLGSELADATWLYLAILAAGVFGAVGGYVPAARYWRKREHAECDATDDRWQFSLRDLFLRFTVASILLACWIFALRWFLNH